MFSSSQAFLEDNLIHGETGNVYMLYLQGLTSCYHILVNYKRPLDTSQLHDINKPKYHKQPSFTMMTFSTTRPHRSFTRMAPVPFGIPQRKNSKGNWRQRLWDFGGQKICGGRRELIALILFLISSSRVTIYTVYTCTARTV